MAFEYAILTEITTIDDSAGAVYTLPASTTAYIRSITIHNANTTAEAVILYNVPEDSGVGTAAATNQFISITMAPGDTEIFEWAAPGIILATEDDTIQGVTDTVDKVTIQIMGATE
jgi:hypothetical protein